MNQIAQHSDGINSLTPISEDLASPVRTALPLPELSDIREPKWHNPVLKQLREIMTLREGWDGLGGGPIRRDAVSFAAHVLEQIMLPTTPPPHVTPMSHGGLMLEWHENAIELEIEIERPGRLWISFEDQIEHINREEPATSDLRQLLMPIEKLTKRSAYHP